MDTEVAPDEIFLDAKNIPEFNVQQFEGRLEQPISKSAITILGIACILIFSGFAWRMGILQVAEGASYFKRSQQNNLDKAPLFANRGIIYDRNNVPLAWNDESKTGDFFSHRSYINAPGLSHILGYVSYPSKDASGNYWQQDFIGKDGLEKQYNDLLQGSNGAKIVEVDAQGSVQSENIVDQPVPGENLHLSIDSRIQTALYNIISTVAASSRFGGGAGVIMDVKTGELLAAVSYPEYDSNILSNGSDAKTITGYLHDSRKVFLDRVVSGLYTPGSIVKPFMALAALKEQVIDPLAKILSTGSISIPNPYDPTKQTVFKDWKAHGWVDMRRAIAVSSDVYFYEIGGGFQGQKGLGIDAIGDYMRMFGISQKTGVDLPGEVAGTIPSPEWKEANFSGDPWRIGDTYHTSIGQYGFQVTPIQMVRADAAIANYGTLLVPHVVTNSDLTKDDHAITLDIPKSYFDVVHEGMRAGVTDGGTAAALNIPAVKIAGKTGTAQLGFHNEFMNSWVSGFFPYDDPRYAFIIMMEHAPAGTLVGAPYVGLQLFQWMAANTPEYLK